ncbi:MAG: DNA polymerase III subunit delta, partial [Candidatus Omnitrophota bacterium]
WIVAEAGKYGKRISPPAVSLLISKLGNNTFLISQALEKTSLYINNKKIIEWNDLEPTIGKEITLDVYKMLNAFLKGNLVEGITILRDIHHFNVRPDKILGIIVAEWRKFYLAKKLLQEGVKYEQIKKELNLFYADIFFSNLNRITLEKIEKSLVELLSVDYAIKMGRTKPFFALELWFLKFFS